ncbi:MAG: arginyltransferase, partial [Luteimonas sp.]
MAACARVNAAAPDTVDACPEPFRQWTVAAIATARSMLVAMGESESLRLFHTGLHPCGYWPERTARDLVLDPRDPRLPQFYAQ